MRKNSNNEEGKHAAGSRNQGNPRRVLDGQVLMERRPSIYGGLAMSIYATEQLYVLYKEVIRSWNK